MHIETGDVIALGSLAVAALTLALSLVRGTRGDAARAQLVDDKLDRISEMGEETRDTVREVDRKLGDHSVRIARLEEQVTTLFGRVERVERTCDDRRDAIGGTD